MLEALRAWLNGTRDYRLGVLLYQQVGDNEPLKKLLLKGKTDFCHKRLQEELYLICISLKNENDVDTTTAKANTPGEEDPADSEEEGHGYNESSEIESESSQPAKALPDYANTELYEACRLEANKVYKDAMNTRAVLFNMVPSELYEDPNRPDLVQARSALSIKVVALYNQASKLYDRADHVRVHGVLPGEKAAAVVDDLDSIPDHLVYIKLDNLRKNYNKMKHREQIPERIVLMKKHEADILKLETRWHSLK